MTEQANTSKNYQQSTRFVSMRWRFISPLFIGVLIVAMGGAYLLARNFAGGLEVSQQNILLQNVRSIDERADALYVYHRNEAQRVTFTVGFADALRDGDTDQITQILETWLRSNGLDSLVATDATGIEIMGVLRPSPEDEDLTRSIGTDLSGQSLFTEAINGEIGAAGYLTTPNGVMLYTAVPVTTDDEIIGTVLIGQHLSQTLKDLQTSSTAHLALYGPDGSTLQSTFDAAEIREAIGISDELFTQITTGSGQVPVQSLELTDVPYQSAYSTFDFGPATLGAFGVFAPDDVPFITETGRQLSAILAAALAGIAVFITYAGMSRISYRTTRVARVAGELSLGKAESRTGLQPTDEISAMGYALDRFADHAQAQQDQLQHALRRQRREINHMVSVIDSIPGGVIVQDLSGRVVMMNDLAKDYLGSQRVFRSAGIHELAELVSDQLGPALAPGIYAIGNPQRIVLDEKMLSAQAAAVLSLTEKRIGTVILLRDITEEVRQERERDRMLQRLTHDIQQPLALLGRAGSLSKNSLVNVFAKEISRQSVALQKMIMDLRELAQVDMISVKHRQQALALETLVWAVANEWRQVAVANQQRLHVMIEQRGLFILGDEKRLRWAIGNLIDNAIKYTLPGGSLTLEIKPEANGSAQLRIRDNGVGIQDDDRAHVFTRFYRGSPKTADGQIIRVPGMGQGLYITRQIIEAHGGKIRLKSSVGVGTAIYLALPLTAPVSMSLPIFEADMEGETVQLPESMLTDPGNRKK